MIGINMSLNKLLVLIGFLTLSTTACAIPRSDVLECGLYDGSKFILTSKYEWSPLNKLNPHNSSGRERQENYRVALHKRGDFLIKNVPVSINYTEIINISSLEQACSEVGVINGVFVTNSSYLSKNDSWFDRELIPEKLYLRSSSKEQTFNVRQTLDVLNAFPQFQYALVLPIKNRLFYEVALSTYKDENGNSLPNGKIVAVYQSISTDDGKTWADPIITKDAKIYELGKSILEQSFIARPISINGKKIEAHFPLPPQK
jgi:hypothetical protein